MIKTVAVAAIAALVGLSAPAFAKNASSKQPHATMSKSGHTSPKPAVKASSKHGSKSKTGTHKKKKSSKKPVH